MRTLWLIALTLLLALPALAAPTVLPNGWTGEVTIDTQRLPNVRFLQVRLVQAARGWTIIEADDIPKATTPARILAWAQARTAWFDAMYAAYLDLKTNRVGQTIITSSTWRVKLLAVTGDLPGKRILCDVEIANASRSLVSKGRYIIDSPPDYTVAKLAVWVDAWAKGVDAAYQASLTVPSTQTALDAAAGGVK